MSHVPGDTNMSENLLVCVYYDPPAIIICIFYLPIHTILVAKFVVGLGKRVLHVMYTVCFKGKDRG